MAVRVAVALALAAVHTHGAQTSYSWTHMDSSFTMEIVSAIPGVTRTGKSLKVSMKCPQTKWCGFGWNTKEIMDGSDVFTFGNHGCCDEPAAFADRNKQWIDNGVTWLSPTGKYISLTQCNLGPHTITIDYPIEKQNVFNRTYASVDAFHTVDFYRPMSIPEDTGDMLLEEDVQYNFLMVQGESINVGYHGVSSQQAKVCTIRMGSSDIQCGAAPSPSGNGTVTGGAQQLLTSSLALVAAVSASHL